MESNVTALLREGGYVDRDGSLALDSNQVVFVYDLPDGEADFNDAVVVVGVGYGDHEVSVRHAVSVSVRNVRLGP